MHPHERIAYWACLAALGMRDLTRSTASGPLCAPVSWHPAHSVAEGPQVQLHLRDLLPQRGHGAVHLCRLHLIRHSVAWMIGRLVQRSVDQHGKSDSIRQLKLEPILTCRLFIEDG